MSARPAGGTGHFYGGGAPFCGKFLVKNGTLTIGLLTHRINKRYFPFKDVTTDASGFEASVVTSLNRKCQTTWSFIYPMGLYASPKVKIPFLVVQRPKSFHKKGAPPSERNFDHCVIYWSKTN
jgi:hypothetical protein